MEKLESLSLVVTVGGKKVKQVVDLCRRPDTPTIWIRFNRPELPPVRRSLRTTDMTEAKRRAQMLVDRLYDQGRDWTPTGPTEPGKTTPTIEEFCAAWEAYYPRKSTAKA